LSGTNRFSFVALGQNNNTMNTIESINMGEIILYQPDSSIRLEVRFENETVWLSIAQMSVLLGRERTVIGRHIRNIFTEGELQESMVCANFAHTTLHGAIKGKKQTIEIPFYNLDVIISVGYRVKSKQGTIFRQWANSVLKHYILRGYAINQRIEQVEKIAIETKHQVTTTQIKLDFLAQYIEDVLSDYNDINEDTRMQLELINRALAQLQVKNKEPEKPRRPIGFR